jgi:thiol-disulfide isomerase/thioredoxin
LTVEPNHLRLDFSVVSSRAVAVHDEVEAGNPLQHHTTLLATDLRLFGEYGLIPGLAVQAMLPLRIVGTKTRYTDLLGAPLSPDYRSIHHRNETIAGIGDPQLLLHRGFKAFGLAFGGRMGISIPLGVVHEDPYRLGDQGLPHEHIQFGTGTWDPVVAFDASAPVGGFSLAAFAGLQAPLYEGPRGYRAGARSQGGLVLSRPFEPVTLRLSAQVLHEQPERWHGHVPTDDGNQGRTDLYVAPGLTWNFTGEWMLNADVRIRTWSHVVNAQLDMPVVLELGIGRLFHLEQGFDEVTEAAHSGGDVVDVVQEGEAAALLPAPGKWTVFDFWARWCEACKGLDAGLRELAARRPGLAVRRVNIVDFDSPIAVRELPGVSMLPRIRLLEPGGKVAYEASGPADELLAEVERRTRSAEPGQAGPR